MKSEIDRNNYALFSIFHNVIKRTRNQSYYSFRDDGLFPLPPKYQTFNFSTFIKFDDSISNLYHIDSLYRSVLLIIKNKNFAS